MMPKSSTQSKARAFPASDAWKQPPVDTRNGQGVPRRPRPRLKKQVEIRIASWNVGSMTGRGRELVEVFKKRNIKIACVQETRWNGKSARELGDGYKIFYSGEKDTRNGVGVILDPTLKERVVEVTRPSDRLIKVKLFLEGETWNVISAYAPQTGLDMTEKQKFQEEMEDFISETPNERLVIGADMNGHVGREAGTFTEVHGGKGFGTRNEDGERILESAESLDLVLVNTFFEKKREHLITYKSGGNETQIDYIMVRKEDFKNVKNCKVIPGEEVVAQHRLLCATIKCEERKQMKKKLKPKIKLWKLAEEAPRYKQEVMENYQGGKENVEETWNKIKTTVLTAAEKVCGKTKGGKAIEKETWWWEEEVQDSIKNKKEAFRSWQKEKSNSKREEYREANKRTKIAVAKAKDKAYKEWYDKLGTKEGENMIYRVTKQRHQKKKDITEILVIKDLEGKVLTEEAKIKERWREYFNKLLNTENEREDTEEVEPVEGPETNITEKEIEEAVKKMKSGKAPGCTGVTVELFKTLGEEGVEMLHNLFNKIWSEEKMPSDWEESEIVPIFKQKGDPLACGNFRGIKLLEHPMKIFERILDQKLRKIVTINDMQFGFRQGRGTIDAVFIVTQLQEKYMEKKKDLYFTFVDLEKAYDRVPRDLVYWCLRKKQVPEKLVRLVMATYQHSKTVVRTCYGQTEKFPIEVGLHQGSALSPFLFVTVLDTISEEFREGLLKELLFADDLVILAESEEELQGKWLRWQEGMERKGLKVNTGKTEVMVSSKAGTRAKIEDRRGVKLKQVDKFKYLGVTLSEEGGAEQAVRARITAAWNKWRECSGVIYDKKIPRKLKVKIYTTVIRPVLLYGAEVWITRKKEEKLMEVTEMRMLRRIKGVSLRDKQRSDDIRNELGVCNITKKIKEARLRWFGHVERREEDNPVKRVTKEEVAGKRGRGRPKKRWSDCVKEDMKEAGVRREDALQRSAWRAKIKATDPAPSGTTA